jgi:cytochrome c553
MRRSTLWLAVAAVACAPQVQANSAAALPQVAACQTCHERDEPNANGLIPILAGQRRGYLEAQLRAFRKGERKHDLMNAIAAQLSDADIAALSTYWSTSPRHVAGTAPAWRASSAEFPNDFPRGYSVYLTVPSPEEKTVSKHYANAAALAAARAGQPLPTGSTVVTVTYSATFDANGTQWTEQAPQAYAVMAARADAGREVPALLRNGEWRYGLFDGQRKPSKNLDEPQCLACHKPRAADSFVFTIAELAKKG